MRPSIRSSRSAWWRRATRKTSPARSRSAARRAPRSCRAGAGTSQCGQTVGEAVVVDTSRYLDGVLGFDEGARRVTVQPGVVLDRLNAWLAPKRLFFPVDVSPSNRATIGGMTGNNSCGARSIRYGNMVHNVHAVNAILADGNAIRFGEAPGNLAGVADGAGDGRYLDLIRRMRALGAREADEIARRFPPLLRRVGGYNIDALTPGAAADARRRAARPYRPGGGSDVADLDITVQPRGVPARPSRPGDGLDLIASGADATPGGHNMAHLLVGSEGTLGFFTGIELDLQPLPAHRVLGVCHFPAFHDAMAATRHIVALDPSAVELVDRTLMELARDIGGVPPRPRAFRAGAPRCAAAGGVRGRGRGALLDRLARLGELMADLGFPGAVVEAVEPAFQRAVWDVRKAGLNIMMSMKGDGKPISFVEDCAVRLEDLPEYTPPPRRHLCPPRHPRHLVRARFGRHPARAPDHRSQDRGRRAHHAGDSRRNASRWSAATGARIPASMATASCAASSTRRCSVPGSSPRSREVKDAFDPGGLFQPGQDRAARAHGRPHALPLRAGLRTAARGDRARLVRMGRAPPRGRDVQQQRGVPQVRPRRDVPLLSGDRGTSSMSPGGARTRCGSPSPASSARDALTSDAMHDTMALCVGCKGCRRECPTGVDMARMKIRIPPPAPEAARARAARSPRRVAAPLRPRREPARVDAEPARPDPGLAPATERLLGLSAKRPLPRWRSDPFRADALRAAPSSAHGGGSEVVLFADTFNTWFEPENARGAVRVLEAAGFRVHAAAPPAGRTPPAVLRADVPRRRPRRGSPARAGSGPSRRSRRSSSAAFPSSAWSPRACSRSATRTSCSAWSGIWAERGSCCSRNSSPRPPPKGISHSPCTAGAETRPPPRPLPPEGVRGHARGRAHPPARAGSGSGDRRIELLRHGRRLRPRGRTLRGVDGDGRA